MKLLIPSPDGHDKLDLVTPAELAEGEAMFNEIVKEQKGFAAKKVPGGNPQVIKEFDPTAEEIVAYRQLVGG